jgi:hypothetical protein
MYITNVHLIGVSLLAALMQNSLALRAPRAALLLSPTAKVLLLVTMLRSSTWTAPFLWVSNNPLQLDVASLRLVPQFLQDISAKAASVW